MNPKGVSVIICTYNGASRLKPTLLHLERQVTTCQWELIIVNNNSTDETQTLAQSFHDRFRHIENFRVITESKSGLTYARKCGLAHAGFRFALFVDDDNWLNSGFIQRMYEVFKENPRAALVGGRAEASSELVKLPDWIAPQLPALAVGAQAKHDGEVGQRFGKTLYGAGLGADLLKINPALPNFISLLDDRKGKKLSFGGDTEMCWQALYAGYEIYYESDLAFFHFMPRARLTRKYIFKLCLNNVSSAVTLGCYHHLWINKSSTFAAYVRASVSNKLRGMLYFLPRMVIGRHKFYSLINFIHNLKFVFLLLGRSGYFKSQFVIIAGMRKKLGSGS